MSLAREAGDDLGRMAALLAYLLPEEQRHEPRARAGLTIAAEMAVNLRSLGALARGLMARQE